ncbi:hypothetical protein [Paenibacillus sp. FSL A5-0031]|uniref:hypothetical protein n=1 Tax=Paenibacillus sp. FSL A5-0031 TaxID=1920420 RepID=UPI0015C3FE6E|nr:hypothetical protein [Paenibacillus sp. FSL A5-0031]
MLISLFAFPQLFINLDDFNPLISSHFIKQLHPVDYFQHLQPSSCSASILKYKKTLPPASVSISGNVYKRVI